MSRSFVSKVSPTNTMEVLQAMARAANLELDLGRRVLGFEVDQATDTVLTASVEQYRRNTNPAGREILGRPVWLVPGVDGWRVKVAQP